MTRVALLHGFTQTGRSWADVQPGLEAAGLEVCAPDAPGHGRNATVQADLEGSARLAGTGCGTAAYVGYSMGGRVALHLALAQPELVERLVLVGATPGIVDPGERATRVKSDDALAERMAAVGLDTFLDEWLAGPLFTSLSPERAGLEARRQNTVEGLASSLRLAGSGQQRPLWTRLNELEMPVLCVVGELDAKFTAIAERMAVAIGANGHVAVVAGAGHACHLEQPKAFLDIVVPFIAPSR